MSFPPLLSELLSHPRAPLEGGCHLRPCGVIGEGVEQLFDVVDTDPHGAAEKLRINAFGFFSFEGRGHYVEQVPVGGLHQLLPFGEDRGVVPPLEALDRLVRLVP